VSGEGIRPTAAAGCRRQRMLLQTRRMHPAAGLLLAYTAPPQKKRTRREAAQQLRRGPGQVKRRLEVRHVGGRRRPQERRQRRGVEARLERARALEDLAPQPAVAARLEEGEGECRVGHILGAGALGADRRVDRREQSAQVALNGDGRGGGRGGGEAGGGEGPGLGFGGGGGVGCGRRAWRFAPQTAAVLRQDHKTNRAPASSQRRTHSVTCA